MGIRKKGYPRKRKSDWPGETGYDYYFQLYNNELVLVEDTFGDVLKFDKDKTISPIRYISGRSADKDGIALAKKYGFKYESLQEQMDKDKRDKDIFDKKLKAMTPAERREYKREELYD